MFITNRYNFNLTKQKTHSHEQEYTNVKRCSQQHNRIKYTNKTNRVLLSFSQIQSESKVNITFNSYSQTLWQNYFNVALSSNCCFFSRILFLYWELNSFFNQNSKTLSICIDSWCNCICVLIFFPLVLTTISIFSLFGSVLIRFFHTECTGNLFSSIKITIFDCFFFIFL